MNILGADKQNQTNKTRQAMPEGQHEADKSRSYKPHSTKNSRPTIPKRHYYRDKTKQTLLDQKTRQKVC